MTDDLCYDRCGACGHVHRGHASGYRCTQPGCECSDRFDSEDAA